MFKEPSTWRVCHGGLQLEILLQLNCKSLRLQHFIFNTEITTSRAEIRKFNIDALFR